MQILFGGLFMKAGARHLIASFLSNALYETKVSKLVSIALFALSFSF